MSRISPRTMTRLRSGSTTDKGDTQPTSPKTPRTATRSPDDSLAMAQKELLRSPKYSDFTVICGERRWECQRSILTQRCHFFAAALTPGYMEDEKNEIDLPEDDPDAVDVMLLYLYTLQNPDFSDSTLFPTPSLTAAGVFKLADKYNIPDLRVTTKDYFLNLVKSSLSTWHQCNSQNRGLWVAWLPIFFEWSMEGADEIREAIIEALSKTCKSIIEDTSFQNVLLGNPDLAIALVKALAIKAKAK